MTPPATLPPTERLDRADPWRWRFEARVLAHGLLQGRPAVALDRSAFYPEGGGQMADHGSLGEDPGDVAEGEPAAQERRRVVDVQVDEAGVVWHALDALPPGSSAGGWSGAATRERVTGQVDGARRRLHMALHTGQHLLSQALARLAGAATTSARLGETAATLDLDRELTLAQAREAERWCAEAILADPEVRAYHPGPEELARLALSRPAVVDRGVRVVAIGALDVTPCGGTHCTRLGQVGLLRVLAVERHRGGTRLTFAAGARSHAVFDAESEALHAVAAALGCAPLEVGDAVARLRRQLDAARTAGGQLEARLVEHERAALARLAAPGEPVVAVVEGASVELLRALAARLAVDPGGLVVLGAPTAEGVHVVAQRGAGSAVECGALLRALAERAGGRGGGRPERAEGRLAPGADLVALTAVVLGGGPPPPAA